MPPRELRLCDLPKAAGVRLDRRTPGTAMEREAGVTPCSPRAARVGVDSIRALEIGRDILRQRLAGGAYESSLDDPYVARRVVLWRCRDRSGAGRGSGRSRRPVHEFESEFERQQADGLPHHEGPLGGKSLGAGGSMAE